LQGKVAVITGRVFVKTLDRSRNGREFAG